MKKYLIETGKLAIGYSLIFVLLPVIIVLLAIGETYFMIPK